MPEPPHTLRWLVDGQVQGVGFRPFIFRLARRFELNGWVRNTVGQVEILAQGEPARLAAFEQAIVDQAPAIAQPVIRHREYADSPPLTAFHIAASHADAAAQIHVPPDYFTCPDCLAELQDRTDRRYRYPFINCTQCGPRYTLIRGLPYDRANTTMADFRMCPACRREYEDPTDRRFHAEPVACPDCGPQLAWHAPAAGTRLTGPAALDAAIAALDAGSVLAIKGIGGYHLMCDAGNEAAIARLRARKPRPHKPLAVMFPDSDALLCAEIELDDAALAGLRGPQRPILLLPRAAGARLPRSLAPGLAELGVMLPYSPLHHLLLAALQRPLVATSANLSGEPVLTDNAEAEARLARIADAFLHHDRPIARPADDSVLRPIAGRPRPLRLGRGAAPVEIPLSLHVPEPLLAVGAHMKHTVALAWEDRLVVSPHIGDMGTARSLAVFRQVVEDLQRLYDVRPKQVLCDAHPDYTTHRWARDCGLPVTPIHHHHAHASAIYGEHGLTAPCLVFTWDGTGYGPDASIWGGETLYGRPGDWRHLAGLRPFRLPGGDQAGREPWRAAAAVCWEAGLDWSIDRDNLELLRQAWDRGVNAPTSTAMGRLFDAAASLIGVLDTGSYEGQGPMWLEALAADRPGNPVACELDTRGSPWRADWAALIAHVRDPDVPAAQRAADFHDSLAQLACDIACQARQAHGVNTVGLTGGVFQNRRLTERTLELLRGQGFQALISDRLPCNDAAISAGQVYDYCYR